MVLRRTYAQQLSKFAVMGVTRGAAWRKSEAVDASPKGVTSFVLGILWGWEGIEAKEGGGKCKG